LRKRYGLAGNKFTAFTADAKHGVEASSLNAIATPWYYQMRIQASEWSLAKCLPIKYSSKIFLIT